MKWFLGLAFCIISLIFFSCSHPSVKDQEQLIKERISINHIKVQAMYSMEYQDGKLVDATTKLISEFYFDPKGNKKCCYGRDNNQRELKTIGIYDKNDRKTMEIWLDLMEIAKWKYYKILHTYDSLNRLERLRLYNTIGELYFDQIYLYDYQGRRACEFFIDTDSICRKGDLLFYRNNSRDVFEKRSYSLDDADSIRLDSRTQYKYDNERNLIEEMTLDSQNRLLAKSTYKYDSFGLKEEETIWDVKTDKPKTIYIYKYIKYKEF